MYCTIGRTMLDTQLPCVCLYTCTCRSECLYTCTCRTECLYTYIHVGVSACTHVHVGVCACTQHMYRYMSERVLVHMYVQYNCICRSGQLGFIVYCLGHMYMSECVLVHMYIVHVGESACTHVCICWSGQLGFIVYCLGHMYNCTCRIGQFVCIVLSTYTVYLDKTKFQKSFNCVMFCW